MSQNKSIGTKCEKKQKYMDLKMGFTNFLFVFFFMILSLTCCDVQLCHLSMTIGFLSSN